MATVDRAESKRRSRRQLADSPQTVAKSHFLRNTVLLLFVLSLVIGYFAPAIIAITPLRNWILQTAVAPNGTITLGSASLGWFSPVSAQNLDIRDAAGDEVVAVYSLASEKTLIGILLDSDDLGRLHVVRPSIHLVAHEKDTNLEQVFAALLTGNGGSNVKAQLDVTEGTLAIDDKVTGHQFNLENLAVDCSLGDAAQGIVAAASGALTGQPQPAGFKVDLRAAPSDKNPAALANGKIECQATALPLDLLQPILRRTVDRAKLSGSLSAQLKGAWGNMAEQGEAQASGEVVVTDLVFASAALGTDEIHLARVEMPCHIVERGDLVEIEKLAVNCELGQVSLSGSAKASDLSAANQLSALAHENYELKANADLAKLVRMLPGTLKIREGTEVTSGQVALVATARQQADGMSWSGRVDASHLGGTADGRPIAWENPLAIQFATHETKDGIIVDQAVCTSSFLQVNGSGSLDDMTATADFDLAQLVTELRRFSDLDQVQLAGKGRARLQLKRAADNQFTADADFQARGFQWIAQNARPWTEDNVIARVAVGGQLNGQALKRIDTALLTVEAGSDHLEAKLREAITDPATATWPVTCSWHGQLAPWAPRLESCLGMTGWNLGGAGTIEAALRGSAKAVEVESAQVDLANLEVQGNGWFVNEPAVSTTVKGKIDLAERRADLTAAKVSAGTVVASADYAVLRATNSGWALDGTAHVEADLAQLARWRQDPHTAPPWHVSGKLNGDAQLKHADGATSGHVDASVDQLQIVDAAHPTTPGVKPAAWQERQITLAARGSFQHAAEQLNLEKLQVVSDALRCDASGAVGMAPAGGTVDLKGTIQYDWEQLAPLWKPYTGPSFQVAGRQARPFAMKGQLNGPPTSLDSWQHVNGEATVGWTGMNAYGLQVGTGEIAAQLVDGEVRVKPIELEISEGRMTFSPVAHLSPSPAELFLPTGPVLSDVHLSPELCAQGLRFVTPLLAGSTTADGRFSISLDGGRLLLSDPEAGDFSGHLAIRGQVKPGPIAQEFFGLIKELTAILQRGAIPNLKNMDGSVMSIDSPNVEFRMVNRRVYHRGLTLVIGTTPITTQGSVGMDESLALMAEVPINARLLGVDLSLGALEGTTLKIPIGGTLSKPKLDRRALQDLPRQLIQNTAREVIGEGLNKGLERLFPGQP